MPKKIRYGVVGLGHIAQVAVLPAFANAKKNSVLSALISSDPVKLKKLGKKYEVENLYSEDQFIECLESGQIDALYIATPNTDHQYYAEQATARGIHVLCEKPLATNSEACLSIQHKVEKFKTKFMVGYRLHFDAANLKAVEMAQLKKLGDLRIFNSVFSMQVTDHENIRLKRDKGGGPLRDIGIYCINASRYLFQAEPTEVLAICATNEKDKRFSEVDEMISVIMKFPDEKIANFLCSFGAADFSHYDLIGSKGSLSLDSSYDYAHDMEMKITIGGKTTKKTYKKHDQFAAEMLYFSECILNNEKPEPSAIEGLADLAVIEAIEKSLEKGRPVEVESVNKRIRPSSEQKIYRPAVKMPETIHVDSPSEAH